MRKVVLVSIKPKYVKEILAGRKLIELRKCFPQKVGNDDFLIIYSTYPEKAVVGICKIGDLISDSPENIWNEHSDHLGIKKSEYFEYFENANKAIGIRLTKVQVLKKKLSLEEIKLKIPKFSPPQTYKYFSLESISMLFKDQIKLA